MKRWKYHPDSGAWEFYQSEDEKMLLRASKTAEQLTVENNQLKDNMSKLLELLAQKNLMTVEEVNQFMPNNSTLKTNNLKSTVKPLNSVKKKS